MSEFIKHTYQISRGKAVVGQIVKADILGVSQETACNSGSGFLKECVVLLHGRLVQPCLTCAC